MRETRLYWNDTATGSLVSGGTVPEPPVDPPAPNYLLNDDFSTWPLGVVSSSTWNTKMGGGGSGAANIAMVKRHECKANPDLGGRMLDLTLLAGVRSGAGSSSLVIPLSSSAVEIYTEIKFKLVAPYDFGLGQKFPGPSGVRPGIGASYPTGGNAVIDEGYSFRSMQATHSGHADGTGLGYMYGSDVASAFGEDIWWTVDGTTGAAVEPPMTDGEWHVNRKRCRLNTVSPSVLSDGIIEDVWDEVPKMVRANRALRVRADVLTTHLLWHWFYGGSTADWAPDSDQHIWIDYVKVWTP